MINIFSKLGIEKNIFNMIELYKKSAVNVIFTSNEKSDFFFSENVCTLHSFSMLQLLEALVNKPCNKARKENRYTDWKENYKTAFIQGSHDFLCRKSDLIATKQNLLKLISDYSEIAGYKLIRKSIAFLYISNE